MTTAPGIDGKVLALRLLREGLHVKPISDRTALMEKEICVIALRNGMSIDEDGVPHIARTAAAPVLAPTGGLPMPRTKVPAAPPAAIAEDIHGLLAAARESKSPKTFALAVRAEQLLAQIRERLEVEKAVEERTQLKDQLAEVEARLGLKPRNAPKPWAKPPGQNGWQPDYPDAEVRAWAKANGHKVQGRYLSKETVAAWREATGGGA